MNRYIRFILLYGLLLLPSLILLAQQGVQLQVLTPPPPDVSALGKFGLVPVDNFTGVPSISVPVYTIKEGTLEFPISLQYHAGGIKVKEDASEVGLGWALNAGGSVVSTTRGQPDFPAGFPLRADPVPDPPAIQLQTKTPHQSLEGWYYQWLNDVDLVGEFPGTGLIYSGLTLSSKGSITQYMNEFTVGYDGQAPDMASDLYMVTLGERAFRFIFDNNKKPVVLGDGSLKIEMINVAEYPDWKVTDENGVAYYFEQRQLFHTDNAYPPNIGTATQLNTWHLTKIVSATYGEIDFKYISSGQKFTEPVPTVSQTYLFGNPSAHTQHDNNKIDAYYTMYELLYIDSIQFSSGYIKFIYDPARLDLKGGWRLQAIEVHDNSNRLVKKIVLDNNYYFTASYDDVGFSSVYLSGFTVENRTKRLKLNALLEQDVTDATNNKKYSFTYNEQLNLPSKMSLSIDHWGFYNGAGNHDLIPPCTLSLSTGSTVNFTGANRDANPATMQANTLTSIQFPTGATTNFTYETNQFYRNETVTTYSDEVSQLYKQAGSATVNTSGFIDANGNFTVGSNWAGKKLEIVSIVTRDPSYSSVFTMDIVVKKDGYFLKRISTIPPANSSMVIDSSIILETGTYNISYDAGSTDFFNSYEIRRAVDVLRANVTTQDVTQTIYSGGLRTSKIQNVDPLTGNVNTKTFTYSNGTEDDLPIYESAEGYDATGVGTGNAFRYRYGQSIYPFSDGRNAPYFGYQKVEVREVDNNNNANGISEYNYSTGGSININTWAHFNHGGGVGELNPSFDHPWIINPIMVPIPDIPGGDRGKLSSEIHYKLENGNKIPVSSINYYYTRENSDTVWQMLFNQGLSVFLSPGYNNEQIFRIYANQFPIPVLRNMLRHKETNEYNETGTLALTKSEDYTYDNVNGHYQLIKKATRNSKGDTLNTYYKYPQDYSDLSSVSNPDQVSQGISLLQHIHVILPIETYNEQIKAVTGDKKYGSGLISVFNNNLPVPKQIFSLETPTPLTSFTPSAINNGTFSMNNLYTSRIRFTQYDANGRLLEQNKENSTPHSYIWDYNSMRLVAEVMNGLQTDIAHTSFEADGTGNWSGIDPSHIQTNGGVTGNKYYSQNGFTITKSSLNAATSYIVSYWALNNSAFAIAGTQAGWPQKTGSMLINGNTWNRFEHLVSGQSVITISGSGSIDELRLYPKGAQMVTYTYDPLVGITTECDQNSRVTFYEYDGFNRLKLIRDHDGNIIKTFDYHYKQ